ncbi:LytTR family transcriptional regulator [Coprobacillus sp. AF34-1BH]|uniref:LytTR family DNA-binding domain-containing protein n=2 Tax=Faecalibacillus faecis TaxID=1982628 RepID=UPI000E5420E9|nr:LytTR family DNA-binding domain-containing protein [Faecalibacillus faecis]RGT60144.1 LytTR family transcriptional regulator [Coprobacillus sp. AF18-40]RGT86190.1 LytTR family transcriptional regulator [Coprobacillus sp. AF18-15LB]RHB03015.1 LytTR family transcriptional regulator [Coprobacillus sp. AM42-12AC]RHP24715.1 LytTR family transcriptional regulator [Coprobacillus sp. AF34-1BH]
MISIACNIQECYFEIIKKHFTSKDYYLEKFNPASYDDIYFIEINTLNDLDKIQQINRYPETLIYIIGPNDFHLLNECLTLGIHLYFEKDDLENSLHSKSETIHQQIFTRFKTYHYKNKQMSFELRLAQIMYVESMNHKLVIHHDNGDFIERKNLSLFIKEINSSDFIQIHKSFVVNKNYIQEIKAKELILKNSTILPIGRNFKESI